MNLDVCIVGGGPAGATMACYLAQAGASCCVLEREFFPRPHVGEAFVPSSTRVFSEIGFLPQIERAGFLRKRGAAWSAADGRHHRHGFSSGTTKPAPVYEINYDPVECGVPRPATIADILFEERDQPGVHQRHTYHVARDKFDTLLLRHAERSGAIVMEGVRVKHVELNGNEDPIVHAEAADKSDLRVSCRIVVDASGRRTLLGNQLRFKIMDKVFDQYALHAWFDGFPRGEWDEYTFVHFLPISNTWMWQIPISDTVTSIGVVTQKQNFTACRETREEFFWTCLKSRPEIYDHLHVSRQVTPFREEGNYSYAMNQICGDRFVMIGDAARFVDPIFSSGVSIAVTAAQLASRDILAALKKGVYAKEAFTRYENTIRRGTRNWHEFITLYYRLNVLFTSFVLDPKWRLDVIKLLQGDLYDEDYPEVLAEMRRMVTVVEENEDHVWHKSLGTLTANAFRPRF